MTHTLRRLTGAIGIIAILVVVLPAAAQAGTAGIADLSRDDGQTVRALLFVAGPGETNSTELTYEAGSVTVSDTLAGGVQAGDGCELVVTAGSRDVRCPVDGLQIAVLALGDGNDVQSVPNLDRTQRPCPLPLFVDAGDGNDVVVTCRDADTVAELGAGDDRLYLGTNSAVEARLGPGDDALASFNGASFGSTGSYDGGPGNDVLLGTTAREAFAGGEGRDRVEFPYNRVDANLDGRAGDSPEGDHVLGDVEELAASVDGSVISGNDAPNALLSGGAGVTLRGLGGDDVLVGSDYGEIIEGGDGSDTVTAGFGHDVIDPGAGPDTVEADRAAERGFAAGNDTVRARDGETDTVSCNIGADSVVADAADVLDACEQVDRASGPAGPGPAGQAGAIAALRPVKASLRTALRKGLKVRVRVRSRSAGRVRLVARHRGRVVARGVAKVATNRTATATLRFDRSARRRLGRLRRVVLRVTATAPDGGRRTVSVALRR